MRSMVLGGGCFWCTEAVFQRLRGVESVVSGYAGGGTGTDPSYWDLHEGKTTHAEVIQVTYDEAVISLDTLLDVFFYVHDPTTPDRQGNNVGPEYRSIILCAGDEIDAVKQAIERNQPNWKNPIVTQVQELDQFTPAESVHQNYYNNNTSAGYCQVIINPELAKFKQKFTHLLKEDS